ncbi:transcriptional regulator [Microtetraspora sp. NBRC 13810]|uniref:GbsR/MarR family transcriptional regulator n=1 Tax=Microtetraspora sp. NBRC 13810 TaxID=3030990 RepID=UPI0024A31C1D|nr:MarR family transcriptional regulator [Microtetraspora sp. NBRC 13810]GLW06911.1 transcriptional regulator [Microtetraspora sp. NBRC 13810]
MATQASPVSDGRNEPAVSLFVERMAMTLAEGGLPRMAARVLMVMMTAEQETLTAADIGTRLGVSPAAVSGAVRYLQQFGLISREPAAGDRRDHFRLLDTTWYEDSLVTEGIYHRLAEVSAAGITALGGRDTISGHRLEEMRDFFQFVSDQMGDLLDAWRRHKHERTP